MCGDIGNTLNIPQKSLVANSQVQLSDALLAVEHGPQTIAGTLTQGDRLPVEGFAHNPFPAFEMDYASMLNFAHGVIGSVVGADHIGQNFWHKPLARLI